MNFSKLKYRSLLLGAGATLLLATSCKDFLDVDCYDQYSPTCLSSKKSYQSLTAPLYGGYIWSQYEGKFAWCVNEGLAGVLFNVNDQEGALFKLSIGDDNSILKEGYTSLYSGVIATSNQVIKIVADSLSSNAYPSDMSQADMQAVLGEAYLFRAYAHFLATEYFGECPLILNSENDISKNVSVPRVSRRTLYAQIEKDLKVAYAYLPEKPADAWRASRYSASALLAKLYLTMASCRVATPGVTYPYICPNPAECIANAEYYLNEIVNSGNYALASHAELFSAANRNSVSPETVFALYWTMGQYAEGSAYQSQMALSSDWSKGSGWGVGKGLTYTLYNSFTESDARKKELCFYVGNGTGNGYMTANGEMTWYGSDYVAKKKAGEVAFGQDGKEFLTQGQHLMNNIKKYVWAVDGTAVHGSGMSIDRRQDIIRLSDVYMMLAEAALLKSGADVTQVTSDANVISNINKVLTAHGAPTIDTIAYFTDFSSRHPAGEKFEFNVTVDDGNGNGTQKTVPVYSTVPMYHETVRADFLQQRRKEFAMEGHAWLDLKRFYYLNPEMAYKFMQQMDRGCAFTNSPEIPEDDSRFQTELGYKRLALVNLCNAQLAKDYPNGNYTVGDNEVEIFTAQFNEKNRWYLPIPSSAKSFLQPVVLDLYNDVLTGTYQY
ncbi:MAG: RagB/SusD family nutrient uptake outer membrane protein [Paludibacteraceae bacterium]|nr:RagB/SusD family nutrient uptake outer membrane protein [Paludibacteraceae bacterium]